MPRYRRGRESAVAPNPTASSMPRAKMTRRLRAGPYFLHAQRLVSCRACGPKRPAGNRMPSNLAYDEHRLWGDLHEPVGDAAEQHARDASAPTVTDDHHVHVAGTSRLRKRNRGGSVHDDRFDLEARLRDRSRDLLHDNGGRRPFLLHPFLRFCEQFRRAHGRRPRANGDGDSELAARCARDIRRRLGGVARLLRTVHSDQDSLHRRASLFHRDDSGPDASEFTKRAVGVPRSGTSERLCHACCLTTTGSSPSTSSEKRSRSSASMSASTSEASVHARVASSAGCRALERRTCRTPRWCACSARSNWIRIRPHGSLASSAGTSMSSSVARWVVSSSPNAATDLTSSSAASCGTSELYVSTAAAAVRRAEMRTRRRPCWMSRTVLRCELETLP